MTIIVVGGGQAAAQAVASLRQEGYTGKLLLVGEEPWPPYQRPPLSKQYLAGSQAREKLFVRPEKFYADKEVELLLGEPAVELDIGTQTLRLAGGRELAYDELILALGSEVRRLRTPGSDLNGVFYLRTIADADAIRSALAGAHDLVIIGGGYIGLEVAAVARRIGLEVRVLEMEKRILQRVTTAETAAFYHGIHSAEGVRIHTSVTLATLVGADGTVCAARGADGSTYEADLVIIGIGVTPVVHLAQRAGIDCDNGIVVDAHCRTSAPHVWAIGDCTNHPCALTSARVRLESVPNALEQARVAAANINAKPRVHNAVPWFWSDQYDLKLQMAGFSDRVDTQVLRGSERDRRFLRFYFKDGVLAGLDAVNNPGEFLIGKRLVGKARVADSRSLADPSVDLKSYAAALR